MTLTADELDRIEARARKASPGPWRFYRKMHWEGDKSYSRWQVSQERGGFVVEGALAEDERAEGDLMADADFIAAAREDVPRLASDLKACQEAIHAVLRGAPCSESCAGGGHRECYGCDNRLRAAVGMKPRI